MGVGGGYGGEGQWMGGWNLCVCVCRFGGGVEWWVLLFDLFNSEGCVRGYT